MDWNRVEGNWKEIKGKEISGGIKEKWGKLTDDNLNVINGRRETTRRKDSTAILFWQKIKFARIKFARILITGTAVKSATDALSLN